MQLRFDCSLVPLQNSQQRVDAAVRVPALCRARQCDPRGEGRSDVLFNTNSRIGPRSVGCLATNSLSCSSGSCRSALNELGAITLAHRMNPSQRDGVFQTCFVMSRESSVVDTNCCSDLYVDTAWITYADQRDSATERTDCSEEEHGEHLVVDDSLHERCEYLGTERIRHGEANRDRCKKIISVSPSDSRERTLNRLLEPDLVRM